MNAIPLPTTQTFILNPIADDFHFNIAMFTYNKLSNWEERGRKFTNSSSFYVSFKRELSDRPLNVLVFDNGVVIITGCKSETDLLFVLNDYFTILSKALLKTKDLKIGAYSTMINVFFSIEESLDLDKFETFLQSIHDLFPHSFYLNHKVDKKAKHSVELKRPVFNLAETSVKVFSQIDGQLIQSSTETLANFLSTSNKTSKLSRKKEVCLYFQSNHNVFFSCTNNEIQADNFAWFKSIFALFRLFSELPV
jgi:hypothetical protein